MKIQQCVWPNRHQSNINGKTAALRPIRFWMLGTVFVALTTGNGPAWAQSAAPGAVNVLGPIVVTEGDGITAAEQAGIRLNAMPGGTAVVDQDSYSGNADVSVSDAIGTVPGVVVQDFFGGNDQPRLQMRGSGLQQSPVERGVLVLKDGLPLNRADGSYVIGLMNPGLADFIEVYRGYTANRLGTNVLGGGLNLVSPTGKKEGSGRLTTTGGSFGEAGVLAEYGKRIDQFDLLGQFNYSQKDGYRDRNSSERLDGNLNLGIELNDQVNTRFFAGYTENTFDIAGPLNKEDLKSDPTQVYGGPTVTPSSSGPVVTNPGPNVQRDHPYRDTQQFRAGNRTTAQVGDNIYEIGLGASYTDDLFAGPIAASMKETKGGDLTGVLKYAYAPENGHDLPLFETTAFLSYGQADRNYYQNLSGKRGAQFGDNDLTSSTLSWQGGLNVPFDKFTLSPAIALSYANRENDDQFGSGMRPVAGYNPLTGAPQNFQALGQDNSYSRSYTGISPSLGASYEFAPRKRVFAALSRSFEPPTHDDLMATVNGTPFFSPGAPANGVAREAFATPDLEAQTATTLEAGTRGDYAGFGWDTTVYYSWIDNELLSLRDASGTTLAATNADKTTHFGAELGLSKRLTDDFFVKVSYTYQDFRFDGDPVHGDNRLAGAPDHVINATAKYDFTEDFMVGGKFTWLPGSTPVDNANTQYTDSWATLDLHSAYTINDTISLRGEITNLFDKTYASSVLISDTAQPGQTVFLPGVGRAFRISLTARF